MDINDAFVLLFQYCQRTKVFLELIVPHAVSEWVSRKRGMVGEPYPLCGKVYGLHHIGLVIDILGVSATICVEMKYVITMNHLHLLLLSGCL